MTPREAFKMGFLMRCIDENLSDEETAGRIKQASVAMEKQAAGTFSALGALGQLTYGGALLGLGLAGVGGAATGIISAKATEPEASVEEQKAQELTQAYKIQAQRARQARARRGFRKTRPDFMLSSTTDT